MVSKRNQNQNQNWGPDPSFLVRFNAELLRTADNSGTRVAIFSGYIITRRNSMVKVPNNISNAYTDHTLIS